MQEDVCDYGWEREREREREREGGDLIEAQRG
jgi:hypothetical protein